MTLPPPTLPPPTLPPLPRHPALFQINTRVLLRRLGDEANGVVTLDGIPDSLLDGLQERGFDWIWFLGVWRTGEAGRAVSRTEPGWQAGFRAALPDLCEADIVGSPFAITGYEVDPLLGDEAALERLRRRLHARSLRLMLDFVPNHMAPDHPWVRDKPEMFVQGTAEDMAREPGNWFQSAPDGPVLARGRDPYFPGWPDTAQLDYSRPETRAAMTGVLRSVAERCDGVRCDMAMLMLPDVFGRTWGRWLGGREMVPFWPDAITAARAVSPGFTLMAEVYWGLEDQLLSNGFDLAYDKALYDGLRDADAGRVRFLLTGGEEKQDRRARFLENHDEPRAAAVFPWPKQRAAALATFASPGLRFFHQGQFEGMRVHIPIHLDRGPQEPADDRIAAFYARLLEALREPALRDGRHEELTPLAAWEGNPSHGNLICALWHGDDGAAFLRVVNLSTDRAQCRVRFGDGGGGDWLLRDRLGPETYRRTARELFEPGLFLDLPGWGTNLFALSRAAADPALTEAS
ncbi:alpha-amylase family glycosyl hydrolase [Rhizosaccharibacter radicis]|uniref:Alpha-amylase family glycosyl hydrolase n=1 Tax=Rhizosaccharibacter radicis TaxID=2782605 RepID=A0ABT1VWP5_9PROT|nr:alpha-amylase family glycosyl hydrolase [Acetobacteraceae bacterium KSS12]